jgi:hypothetical protein
VGVTEGTGTGAPTAELKDPAIDTLEQLFPNVHPDASDSPISYVMPHNKTFALEHSINLDNQQRIWLLPDALKGELVGVQPPGLTVEFRQRTTNDPSKYSTDPIPPIEYANFDTRWAMLVDLILHQIPDVDNPGSYLKDVFLLTGTDEESRSRLEELLSDPYASELSSAKLIALRRVDSTSAAVVTKGSASEHDVGIAKVNLSTESFPGLRAAVSGADACRADLAEPVNFLRLIVQCSIVHAGGYYLHHPDLPTWLFDGTLAPKHVGRLSLLVQLGTLPAEKGAHAYNALVLTNAPGAPLPDDQSTPTGLVFYAETPDRIAYAPIMDAGNIGFCVSRANPEKGYQLADGTIGTREELMLDIKKQPKLSALLPKVALDALFSLLVFNVVDDTEFSGTTQPTQSCNFRWWCLGLPEVATNLQRFMVKSWESPLTAH